MVATLLLPLLVFAVLSGSDSASINLEPCDVSLFKDSVLIILGSRGFVWADGDQHSLEALNEDIDRGLNISRAKRVQTMTFRWNTAKLFYTANYTKVLVAGFDMLKPNSETYALLRIGVFDVQQAVNNTSGFKPLDEIVEAIWNFTDWTHRKNQNSVARAVFENVNRDEPVVCDTRTMVFDPNTNNLVFDGDKEFKFKLGGMNGQFQRFRLRYHDKFWKDGEGTCSPSQYKVTEKNDRVPYETSADFHGRVKGDYGNFYLDPFKKKRTDLDFFFNQLETGNFKLQAELVVHNGTEYYYHILTRLKVHDLHSEVQKCYVRRFVKEPAPTEKEMRADPIGTKGKQPLEYPRMLIIPKENRTDGVNLGVKLTTTSSKHRTDL